MVTTWLRVVLSLVLWVLRRSVVWGSAMDNQFLESDEILVTIQISYRTYGSWCKGIGRRRLARLWSIWVSHYGDGHGSLVGTGTFHALAARGGSGALEHAGESAAKILLARSHVAGHADVRVRSLNLQTHIGYIST